MVPNPERLLEYSRTREDLNIELANTKKMARLLTSLVVGSFLLMAAVITLSIVFDLEAGGVGISILSVAIFVASGILWGVMLTDNDDFWGNDIKRKILANDRAESDYLGAIYNDEDTSTNVALTKRNGRCPQCNYYIG